MSPGRALLCTVALAVIVAGCGGDCDPQPTPPPSSTPTPSATPVAPPGEFDVVVSAPRFIIPSEALPPQLPPSNSNNNVDILFYDGRLYLAWRTAPHHFAGPDTHLYVMSSADNGATWQFEHDVFLATDMREPRLLGYAGYLQLMFFEAGSDSGNFEPRKLWRTRRLGPAEWSDLELLTDGGEVPWDLKIHDGIAYRTSYQGEHYGAGDTSEIAVFFKQSTDGTAWTPVGGKPNVYYGGVSEVAFEFDTQGALWAVTRNEDGDASGFGAHVCYAPPHDLSAWECSAQTDPDRYDSPEMFRHGDDLYLVARRDVGGPYDARDDGLTLAERRGRYLVAYSLRPKRTALYKIDKQQRTVVHVMDVPGVGDCSFPSVQQTGPHTYLLANYTSPLDMPDVSWLRGQTSERGTQIYLATLTFEPYVGPPRSATPTWTPTPSPTPRVTETPLRVVLAPVFAPRGEPLAIEWPDAEDLVALVALGDGTSVDPSVTTHEYAAGADAVFPISGSLQSGATAVPVVGAVARTNTRVMTPLNGFTLTEPSEDVVVNVIRGVLPAFHFAFDVDTLAVVSDPSADGDLRFDEVGVAAIERGADGAFSSAPIDFALELSVPAGTRSGVIVRLRAATWSGRFDGAAPASPIELAGDIVVEDIVDAAAVVANLDHEAALAFIAGLLNFDPADPPETVPFRGDMAVEPVS
jgi:hypothetical protein